MSLSRLRYHGSAFWYWKSVPHAHIWCSDSVWFAWLSAFCTNLSTHWSTL